MQHKTLAIRDNIDASDHVRQSVLLHELMHHAQCLHGKRDRCSNEREAYNVQAQWLRAKKSPPTNIAADMMESWGKRDCAQFR